VVVVKEDGAGGGVAADGVEGVEVLVQHQQIHHVLGGRALHAVGEVHDAVPVERDKKKSKGRQAEEKY